MKEQELYLHVWTTLVRNQLTNTPKTPAGEWELAWQGKGDTKTGELKGLWTIPNPPKIYYLRIKQWNRKLTSTMKKVYHTEYT
jgi:hypothetical protein